MKLRHHFLMLIISTSVLVGGFFSFVTVYFFSQAQNAAITIAQKSFQETIATTHDFLNEEGKQKVREAADHFITHIEIYLRTHPDATIQTLQNDPDLEVLRKQARVGKTGYITIMQADNLLFIGHPNPKFVGQPYDNIDVLKDPKFADITKIVHAFRDTQGHVEGYYTWIEPDGRITEKFLSYSISSSTTKDGKRIGVNASTYLDEFNFSINEADRRFQEGVVKLEAFFVEIFTQFLIVLGILALCAIGILILVPYIGYRSIEKYGHGVVRKNLSKVSTQKEN